jgi:50S ribosomal protein L16 3-hydroxylase
MHDDTPFGGIPAAQFMRRHWQKSERLIRRAIPDFAGLVDRRALFALAGRDDVESRLIVKSGTSRTPRWSLEHGPFRLADFRSLPAADWTLLVQGLDLHLDAASRLLQRFDFISHARLDDLMLSYAVPGGGVGPHFDSYDVFLLQGPGRRLWRTSTQTDLTLVPNLPLKLLRNFAPATEAVLDPGDMLYLPPHVAHDGIAVTECMTYSIGFRAPTARELIEGFLQFLPDVLEVADWRYADPDLKPTAHPGRIDRRMQTRIGSALKAVRWDARIAARFIGSLLSEPKPEVFLEPPTSPLSRAAFARRIAGRTGGVRLDRRSRMLYDAENVYLNGSIIAAVARHPALMQLADRRMLPADVAWTADDINLLHAAYLTGALHAGTAAGS